MWLAASRVLPNLGVCSAWAFPASGTALGIALSNLGVASFAVLTGAVLSLERCVVRHYAAFASSAQVRPPERCSEYDVRSA